MNFNEWFDKQAGLSRTRGVVYHLQQTAWKAGLQEGYELGKASRIGLNKSGCVCL